MKDFQVGFLNLFNLGVSHSGLGCDVRIKNSAFGTNPIIPYQFYKEMEVVFFSLLSPPAPFPPPPRDFDPSVSYVNNSSKQLVSLTKLATGQHERKSLKSLIKSSALKVSFAEKGFLTS